VFVEAALVEEEEEEEEEVGSSEGRLVGEGKLVREGRASASRCRGRYRQGGSGCTPSRRVLGRAITACAINACAINVCAIRAGVVKASSGSCHQGRCGCGFLKQTKGESTSLLIQTLFMAIVKGARGSGSIGASRAGRDSLCA